MRIENINLPGELAGKIGLGPVEMTRLREVVLIAGKNGSGKTRLLGFIKAAYNTGIDTNFETTRVRTLQDQIYRYQFELEEANRGIAVLEERLSVLKARDNAKEVNGQAAIDKTIMDLNTQKTLVDRARESILEAKRDIDLQQYFKFSDFKSNQSIVEFVPKQLTLQDSYKLSPVELKEYSDRVFKAGTEKIEDNSLPAIQSILNKWSNALIRRGNGAISELEFDSIKERYEKLQNYIHTFLGTKIESDGDGYATIYGKLIGEANLSDGQKVLIQFCIALYAQDTKLGETIIFMDEPENHLHPATLLDVLDKIKAHIGKGQLWIATHSIHILAHFDTSYTWYVDEGNVSYAGTGPQKVLDGLLGSESEIGKLSDYLSLPAKLASENFAYQCLISPDVVLTNSDDPQILQIHKIISSRIAINSKLRVLDIGVGKGRLIASIAENENMAGRDVVEWLQYFAYDKYDKYAEICKKQISDVYGKDATLYFNDERAAIDTICEGSCDFIVMCNVLHEIPPSEWKDLFASKTSLMNLLKPEGFLLIVEDQFLAVGEKAHSNGFLVFDTLELKALFGAAGKAEVMSRDHRGDGRLKAHMIPAKFVRNVSSDTRKEALTILADTARKKIKEVRGLPPNYKNGKLHSFWAQQFANASLALSEL